MRLSKALEYIFIGALVFLFGGNIILAINTLMPQTQNEKKDF